MNIGYVSSSKVKLLELTVVLVMMIGGWNGYLSLNKMSKLKNSMDLSLWEDLTIELCISSYN